MMNCTTQLLLSILLSLAADNRGSSAFVATEARCNEGIRGRFRFVPLSAATTSDPTAAPRDDASKAAIDDAKSSGSHRVDPRGDLRQAASALRRAAEIARILAFRLTPLLTSLAENRPQSDWEAFWSDRAAGIGGGGTGDSGGNAPTNARRLADALEALGPTYVKFGQALGSRPDVVPPSLARALSALQDEMTPFDGATAAEIVRRELGGRADATALMEGLGEPVAAASIGQVYKAHLPGRGHVAVKVQRPGVRQLVQRDTELLLTVAQFLESLPALPAPASPNNPNPKQQTRMINTQLLSTTKEFMSRIFEELDYTNEARNIQKFAALYSKKGGSSTRVRVVVPEVYTELCTENVLVMEWIEGTKLTDVRTAGNSVRENLALVKAAIDSTLSQLLVTGVLHADPHAGNLLKVRSEEGSSVTLGYLDFGLLSTIPAQVRDALVCAVALQVFERDVDAVSSLFGELQLIPQHVLADPAERKALAEALEIAFQNSLLYPKSSPDTQQRDGEATAIPELKFDKLLDSLSRLVPRFRFDLPPYFINNARALSTLEGIAKSLDPSFNVLTVMYPYALNLLLRNPSKSPVVESTLQRLMRSKDGRIDRRKISRLLRDSALISGVSKRRVAWDVVKTREGRKLAMQILGEEVRTKLEERRRKRRKRWYYLEL